jgi:protein-disulfide isomerase
MKSDRNVRGNASMAAIAAALIVAMALLGGSWLMSRSMGELRDEVAGLKVAFEKATGGAPQQAAEVPKGPDPEARHTVDTKGAPLRGPQSAKVTIVAVSDFQCPFCKKVEPTLQQILQTYPNDVRIAYKHMPLDFHAKAPEAHAAAEAAHQQGKFWEMYAKIFENQTELSLEKYEAYALDLGLDVDRFKQDMASIDVKQRIDADKKEVEKLGVMGTPAFFINGRYLSGAQPFENFKALIDAELGQRAG